MSTIVNLPDDTEAIYRYFDENDLVDGHPIVTPTRERVKEFIDYLGRDPQEIVAFIEPSEGAATIEKIVANAVMAGCRREYLPVVIAAIEALGKEIPETDDYAAHPVRLAQTTAHSASPFLLINGPAIDRLGITSGNKGSAVSWHANASIARAMRFVLHNIGGISGATDMRTFGWLVMYSYCMAEDEEHSPWEPYHVEHGFAPTDSAVTVFFCEPPHHLEIFWPASEQQLLHAMCDSMCTVSCRSAYGAFIPTLVLCPEHARALARAGFSKADVKRFVFDHARIPYYRYGPAAREGMTEEWRKFYTHSPHALVPMLRSPQDLDVVVLGGSGPESLFMPSLTNIRPTVRIAEVGVS